MAIITCKMCGGSLNVEPGNTVAVCEYCDSQQTIPSVDDEKKLKLFERANRLRSKCEFDKAAGVYESIVADFPEEAEAYWGLVLCKYGIEYVTDPATGDKVPTCHRSSYDSVLKDNNFEMTEECADVVARRVYRAQAKAIEELRKDIIEVSGKEEPYDIFICYKETAENGDRTEDSVMAYDVYEKLVNRGYRVFFSRVTLEGKLGSQYEPLIFAALNSARIMLVFGTDYDYFNAVWVKNEWSRYLQLMQKDKEKRLIPCFKGIDPYDMPDEFQKLQAQDMGKIGAEQDLVRGVEKLLPRKKEEAPVVQQVVQQVVQGGGPNVQALLKRGNLALEDNDWSSAANYFDQVLNMDAECGEAYLGKVLVEWKLSGLRALSRKFAPDQYHPSSVKCSAGQKDEQEETRQRDTYFITNYLSRNDIKGMQTYSFTYESTTNGWKDIRRTVESTLKSNRNLTRAETYATPELKSQIRATVSNIYSSLDEMIDKCDRADRDTAHKLVKGYEEHLKALEDTLIRKRANAEERREADYQRALSLFTNSDLSGYQQCQRILNNPGLTDYKETKKYLQLCDENIARIKEENRIKEEKHKAQVKYAEEEKSDKSSFGSIWITAIIAIVLLVGLTVLAVNCSGWVENTLIPSAGFDTFFDDSGAGEGVFTASAIIGALIGIILGFCGAGLIGGVICVVIAFLVIRLIIACFAYLLLWMVNPIALIVVAVIFGIVIFVVALSLNHKKNLIKVLIPLALLAAATVGCYFYLNNNVGDRVAKAQELLDNGQYLEAIEALEKLGNKADPELLKQAYYGYAGEQTDDTLLALYYGKAAGYKDARQRSLDAWEMIAHRDSVQLTYGNVGDTFLGLKSDGTVIFTGGDEDDQLDVSGWTDIVDVANGGDFTVGLKSDGTVVLASNKDRDWYDEIRQWTNIVDLTYASMTTNILGLKSDGTVVVAGNNPNSSDVSDWTDIIAIEGDSDVIVGLKVDGTVVSTHNMDVLENWTDIAEIFVDGYATIGLKEDGTLVCTNSDIESEISQWTDVVHVAIYRDQVAAVNSNGEVYLRNYSDVHYHFLDKLMDIAAVYATTDQLYAQRKDGTFIDVKFDYDLSAWTGVMLPN